MNRAAYLAAIFIVGCSPGDDATTTTLREELPSHFPAPPDASDNPSTAAAIELGRHLFYDTRLSFNGTLACSDCHKPQFAFADNRALSPGATSAVGGLNAPSLANVAYSRPLGWAQPSLTSIEDQLVGPMFGESPIEMGIAGHEVEVSARLRDDADYRGLFAAAYPDGDPSIDNARMALASFVRSLVSYRSPFDRFLAGDRSAISRSAELGADLFFSSRLGCGGCHGGFLFTAAVQGDNDTEAFHNIGLYNLDGEGAYPPSAPGVISNSGLARDMGRFRTPSLRNVALSAPYMHDGSVTTLEEVIDIYENGGRLIDEGPLAGDGRDNPFRSPRLKQFELDDSERQQLLAFLESLSDEALVSDPAHQSPW